MTVPSHASLPLETIVAKTLCRRCGTSDPRCEQGWLGPMFVVKCVNIDAPPPSKWADLRAWVSP